MVRPNKPPDRQRKKKTVTFLANESPQVVVVMREVQAQTLLESVLGQPLTTFTIITNQRGNCACCSKYCLFFLPLRQYWQTTGKAAAKKKMNCEAYRLISGQLQKQLSKHKKRKETERVAFKMATIYVDQEQMKTKNDRDSTVKIRKEVIEETGLDWKLSLPRQLIDR